MSTIRVNAIQHTTANGSNMTLFANGNIAMTTANTTLTVGNTTISNNSISVGGTAISQYGGMMKNRIINGAMVIDQRFCGTANNNINGGQFVIDRWMIWGSAAGKVRLQQNNTNGPGSSATQLATGFSNYFGANTVSAATIGSSDYYQIGHYIEGYNIADLGWGTPAASPVTLSFWVYSSTSGMHSGAIANYNGNANYAFPISVSTANTWEYKTVTIPGNTSSGMWFSNSSIGMIIYYNLGIGSTYSGTGNTWSNAQGITGTVQPASLANGAFYVTGVQLEKGSQATPFEFRHFTSEFELCQRYFQKSYNDNVIPGTSTDVSIVVAGDWNGGERGLAVSLPIRMRASPTIKMWDRAGNINKYSSLNSSGASGTWYDNFGSLTLVSSGQSNFLFYPGSSSSLITAIHFWASAELAVTN